MLKHTFTIITSVIPWRYLQSKCFFLGPSNSSVVALQTDFAKPCPARLCFAANKRSLMVCPAMIPIRYCTKLKHNECHSILPNISATLEREPISNSKTAKGTYLRPNIRRSQIISGVLRGGKPPRHFTKIFTISATKTTVTMARNAPSRYETTQLTTADSHKRDCTHLEKNLMTFSSGWIMREKKTLSLRLRKFTKRPSRPPPPESSEHHFPILIINQ